MPEVNMTDDEYSSRVLLEKALYFIECEASDRPGALALIDKMRAHLSTYPVKVSTEDA